MKCCVCVVFLFSFVLVCLFCVLRVFVGARVLFLLGCCVCVFCLFCNACVCVLSVFCLCVDCCVAVLLLLLSL